MKIRYDWVDEADRTKLPKEEWVSTAADMYHGMYGLDEDQAEQTAVALWDHFEQRGKGGYLSAQRPSTGT